jgi:hypothetical protein
MVSAAMGHDRADREPSQSASVSGDASPHTPIGRREFRTDLPHPARVYDCFLGGKDNYAADRDLAERIRAAVPTVPAMARANRAFMQRATKYLAGEAKIRQFLDIGTGIPTEPNLHQVAQRIAPQSRVVYVDNDPVVLAHARALLTSTPHGRCAYLDADLNDPIHILHSQEVTDTLDLDQPVAVTLGSILMLLPDAADPWVKVATLIDAMPAGSHLVVSHPTADFNPEAMAQVVTATSATGITFVPRPREAVARFFTGCQLVPPGLVPVLAWRPAKPPKDPQAAYYWAGVAKKCTGVIPLAPQTNDGGC